MSYRIEILPRARKELVEAWNWYDDRWVGLGDRFMGEVEKRLHRLQKRKKVIAVSSIFHTRRNPREKYKEGK